MLLLKDITNYFKELNTSEDWKFENFYRGKLDNRPEKSLGFYDITEERFISSIGGSSETKQKNLYVSVLIHWNKFFDQTEDISNKVYNKLIELSDLKDIDINGNNINFIELVSGNEDIGTDDKNVYERVIQIRFNYTI